MSEPVVIIAGDFGVAPVFIEVAVPHLTILDRIEEADRSPMRIFYDLAKGLADLGPPEAVLMHGRTYRSLVDSYARYDRVLTFRPRKRKHWVMDKDWNQRERPRRRKRRAQ